jgi:hypothetical protein
MTSRVALTAHKSAAATSMLDLTLLQRRRRAEYKDITDAHTHKPMEEENTQKDTYANAHKPYPPLP